MSDNSQNQENQSDSQNVQSSNDSSLSPFVPQQQELTQPATQEPQQQELTQPATQEPQQPNPYQSVIDQQQAQIAALMEQNTALNQQVVNMLQNGAQFNGQQAQQQAQHVQPVQQFNPPSLNNGDDYSLEALGKEIGK